MSPKESLYDYKVNTYFKIDFDLDIKTKADSSILRNNVKSIIAKLIMERVDDLERELLIILDSIIYII